MHNKTLPASSRTVHEKSAAAGPFGLAACAVSLLASFLMCMSLSALPVQASADSAVISSLGGSDGQAVNAGIGTDTSENWSGYSASGGGTYSGVGSSWTVPEASETKYSADAAWVGIGGVNTTDLIQVGTQALADDGNTNGAAAHFTYKAWYEVLPDQPLTIPVAVSPGDSVTASITEQSSGQWLLSFQDVTTGQSYQRSAQYDSSMSSAEWIQEMPLSADTGLFVPLDIFGNISFQNAWATLNDGRKNLQQLEAAPMTMINYSRQALAAPSPIGAGGGSFSVSRTSAAVTSGAGVGSHSYHAYSSASSTLFNVNGATARFSF